MFIPVDVGVEKSYRVCTVYAYLGQWLTVPEVWTGQEARAVSPHPEAPPVELNTADKAMTRIARALSRVANTSAHDECTL